MTCILQDGQLIFTGRRINWPSKILRGAGPGAQQAIAFVSLLKESIIPHISFCTERDVYLTGWSTNIYRTAYQLAILCVSHPGTKLSHGVSLRTRRKGEWRHFISFHTLGVQNKQLAGALSVSGCSIENRVYDVIPVSPAFPSQSEFTGDM